MSRILNLALEKYNEKDAVTKATDKGKKHAKRIADAIDAASRDGIVVDHVSNHGGKARVRLQVPHPDSRIGRKITVGHES
jgi:hypothetical protein